MSVLLEEWPTTDSSSAVENDDHQCNDKKSKTQTEEPSKAMIPRTISLKSITSAQDLTSLKRSDPFLYYSIPGVRSAKLLGKDIDTSDLGTCKLSTSSYGNSISGPNLPRLSLQDNNNDEYNKDKDKGQSSSRSPPHQIVKRSSCISFECHPDFLMIEELANEDDDFDIDFADYDNMFVESSSEEGCDDAWGFLLSAGAACGAEDNRVSIAQ